MVKLAESNKATSIAKLALIFLALFILCILLAYDATALLTTDIGSYYKMEAVAYPLIDSVGNINMTNTSGSPDRVPGIINFAQNYSQANDVGGDDRYESQNLTWNMWYYLRDDATAKVLFAKFDSTTGNKRQYMVTAEADETIEVRVGYNSGASQEIWDLAETFNTGTWEMVTCTWDNSANNWTIYLNGTYLNSHVFSNGMGSGSTKFQVGDSGDYVSLPANHWEGRIDEVGIWTRVLNASEIQDLYNSGSGCQYPFTTCSIQQNTTVNFTAIDDFDGSAISSFNLNITWQNGTTQSEQSTSGYVYLNLLLNNASLITNLTYYNITNYFDNTLINEVITANTSNNIQGSVYQAVATLTATEKITNNSLSGVTFYIGSKSGSVFNLTAGTHNVTAVKAGYYNLTSSITVAALSNNTYNLEGMYNAIAQFSAYNALTNASISSFTVYLDIGETLSTTNGTVSTGLINNTNYTLNISGSGFATSYNVSYFINETPQIVNISLYTFNSIRINIFNESNMEPLLQSVTIHTISNLTTFSNITSTGFILIDLLQPSDYELRFESSGFNPRSLFLTVTNDSTQNISVYMTENTTTELQVIEVLNTANQPIEGAIVWLQKEELNQTPQWVTIQESQTDYAGKTSVFVERDVTVFYRFAVIYEGVARPIEPSGNLFTGKTTFIPGITETIQLIVDLEGDPEDFISDALAIAVNCTLNNLTARCTIVDGRNSIAGAVMRIDASYINESLNYENIANVSFSGSSGTLEFNLTEVNNSVWRVRTYLQYESSEALVWETLKRFDADVIIGKNTGLLYAAIILIIVFALTVKLGPLASGLIGFSALIPLTYIKLISIPIGVITGLLALVIIFFLRTRKLDE